MSAEPSLETDDASYGELLGEYLSVVAEVARTLDEFGRPRAEAMEEYGRLRARKAALRERLAAAERDEAPTEYESLLDDAFSSE